MTTNPKKNAEVYKVVDPVRGLPHVLPGDHVVLWEEGQVTLQRMVDEETFTALGTANALEFLPQTHQVEEMLTKATDELREAMDEWSSDETAGLTAGGLVGAADALREQAEQLQKVVGEKLQEGSGES